MLFRSKNIERLQSQLAGGIAASLLKKAVRIGEIDFIAHNAGNEPAEIMKLVAGIIRNSSENTVLVAGSAADGKASLIVMVSDKLAAQGKTDAVRLIKEIAPEVGGSGGGQPFLAIAGGKNPDGIDKALEKARKQLENI